MWILLEKVGVVVSTTNFLKKYPLGSRGKDGFHMTLCYEGWDYLGNETLKTHPGAAVAGGITLPTHP
jgi:hypothetical protein